MPVLVFLHGLLGTRDDWQKVIENLPHFSCIALDLPFHGLAKQEQVADFSQTCDYIATQIRNNIGNKPYYLIGYSLGGRIALYYALQYSKPKGDLKGLILEGAHLGLTTEQEKQARWQQDQAWAERFNTQLPQNVLNDWYQQPVFAHLTATERTNLIQKRSMHCGRNIAQMLLATSLAKQPDFRAQLQHTHLPIHYFCGEKDQKFQQLARAANLDLTIIQNAGHNAHLEQSQQFAINIQEKIIF
ncbi:putative 2-succinyl-6-hydroxy-2,4-cyclohexadiene-1-carboxylate synthase [Pasteurella canis]|uniref:2-succinyl-6-hydroxy-2, 4-cyclohexadiene-1-carboxylate synthase n=1 Tax=Pasteurella canis TaxID=753 RepID=UPI001E2AC785|nr:2-succinyl-6-hydroxy-2,4-cyclohexadiene-1-carboxylate synthase [Pasteurella canis]GJJ80243.1 putative 2-succinyl-6-hydroxy-2,4-cyclohexadiene-1-carboxylate synthase [Pasteurella canis]